VLHKHPPLATAWSATRRPVRPLDQTSSIFFERQAWCAEFEDVEHLVPDGAGSIGGKRAVIPAF
jgi:ribulose-5-phosphate 4-epimerase/fuculose-1-phosphate aldolase